MTTIGVFDSGVGGLSVLRHLRTQLPSERLVYVADQAHAPYGPRPAGDVCRYSEAIVHFLRGQGAALIVVACNTATAAALTFLRQTFPALPFVGMEPAVKPGAAQTRSGQVGVLATNGTFESQRYASLMRRYARDVTVHEDRCAGLVEAIESGDVAGADVRRILTAALTPMLAAGVDTVILGCTHYPFVLPLVREVVGPRVAIIDPAPAVARQTGRLLQEHALATSLTDHVAPLTAFTSGDPAAFAARAAALVPELTLEIATVRWIEGRLTVAPTEEPQAEQGHQQ